MTELETFDAPSNSQVIQIVHPEFSSKCPKTGYPDFAKIVIRYMPDMRCVELKSWKLYLASFYNVGAYHEDVTKKIFDKFIEEVSPKEAMIISSWGARGGLKTVISSSYDKESGQYGSIVREMEDAIRDWTNT